MPTNADRLFCRSFNFAVNHGCSVRAPARHRCSSGDEMETEFWDRAVGALRGGRLFAGEQARRTKWSAWWARRLGQLDRGMTTSEYAVGTIAACAFAAVLYKVVNSGPVLSALQSLVEDALDAKF
ncbi:DUF4244 domain-containing protein [Streptomyces parvus]|uniref:DUF4244 domain-containing protein n=2 Tax=Streptomyces parvus TaxID=66428 RepID=UPI0037A95F45